MRTFGRYLWSLVTTWWGAAFLLAGAISTSATFISIYWPGFTVPRWILGAISVIAWLVAPYRLYQRQQAQIENLTATQFRPRCANLKIIEERKSYFMRCSTPQAEVPRHEVGIYLELIVSVENKGDRASTITRYDLHIENVGDFSDVRPSPQTWIWGVRAQHPINAIGVVGSYIEVAAERLASHQRIPFMLDFVPQADAGQLRCELTVWDTEGNSASAWMTATQRG